MSGLRADGDSVWLEPPAGGAGAAGGAGHAAGGRALSGMRGGAPTSKELWFFDLTGYLVVPGVMDAQWLRAAHEAYEWGHRTGALTQPPHQEPPPGGNPLQDGLPGAQWSGEGRLGPLTLPAPHAKPFRDMLAHPAVLSRLEWMMGRGYRLWGPPSARETPVGGSGQLLHAGLGWSQRGIPADFHSYDVSGFEPTFECHAEAINVAWQLNDQGQGDGGFVVPLAMGGGVIFMRPCDSS